MAYAPFEEPMRQSVDFSLRQDGSSTKSKFDALYQSVESILRIDQGSQYFDPFVGSFLEETLFKRLDAQLASILELRIENLVKEQDTRIDRAVISIALDIDGVSYYMEVTLYAKDAEGPAPTRRYSILSND